MFDWEDMRIFAVLASESTLAGAARVLKVNHATVSRRVSALEAALGVKLVRRLARSTPLTEQGRVVAGLATRMEAEAHQIVLGVRKTSASLTGKVTITAPPALAEAVVIPGLAPLRERHPGLIFDVLALSTIVSLDRGDADLAIRLVQPDRPGHLARRVGSLALGLYANEDVAARPPKTWTFIAYDDLLDHVPQQRWLMDHIGDRPIALRTSDAFGQIAAARAGFGVAILPCRLGDAAAGLVRVAPTIIPPPRDIWLVIHPDLRRAPAVRVVADHVAGLFR